jgi:uncharacterized membrane protein (UPF0127 family)
MLKKFALQVALLIVVITLGLAATINPTFFKNLSFLNQETLIPRNTNQNNKSQTTEKAKVINIRVVSGQDNSEKAKISVEVVDTPSLRSKGLGFRDSLGQDSGMLFVFEATSQYKFWMKGMRFPLDMLWIKDDTIVDIIKNVPNPSANTPDSELPVYAPTVPINRILEVNAGYVDSHGIVVGDKFLEVQ